MKRRILTGLPLALVVVYLIVQGREWLFVMAVLATVMICLHEYFHLSREAGLGGWPWMAYIGAGALCLGQMAVFKQLLPGESVLLLLLILAIPIAGLLTVSDLKSYSGALASTVLGVFYVGFAFSWIIPLRFADPVNGCNLTIMLFLVVWGEDIFAYVVGRMAGRIPLAKAISPKKTVEGAIAGLVGSVLVAWGFSYWFWQTGDQKTVILIAGVVALAGQAGDLVESALKRAADLKDSGTILPGHGGLLDRVDSLLFAVPTLWLVWHLKDFWH
ncbi:MAG: phosphatidate cytidylyltransferase [Acidobacteria bacterium]|nr:phosphatidate cytidylyltransferase [Acidobacteriota bacterium]